MNLWVATMRWIEDNQEFVMLGFILLLCLLFVPCIIISFGIAAWLAK